VTRYGADENFTDSAALVESLRLRGLTCQQRARARGVESEVAVFTYERGSAQSQLRMIITYRRHNIGITQLDREQPPYSLPRNAAAQTVASIVDSALAYRGPVAS
jgi:hypothetical protein